MKLFVYLVSNLFLRPIRQPYFFQKLNFYFNKKAEISVYGDIEVYGNIALSVCKID